MKPLMTVRATLIVFIALVVGAVASGLSWLSGQALPAAVLFGLGAAAAAIGFFNQVISDQ